MGPLFVGGILGLVVVQGQDEFLSMEGGCLLVEPVRPLLMERHVNYYVYALAPC